MTWTFYDANGNVLSAASGGLTSPVGISDGGTGYTTKTPAFDALSPTTSSGDIIYNNGTNNVRLAAGSAGQVLTLASGVPAWKNKLDYILVRDEKASTTHGGTFTSGAWQTRDLNTEVTDTGSHASVASNQITLAAGTYIVDALAPAIGVVRHQARLYDVTNSAVLLLGTTERCGSSGTTPADFITTSSRVKGLITLSVSTVIEVQHYCVTTGTTTGFGYAASITTEVYTVIEFTRISD